VLLTDCEECHQQAVCGGDDVTAVNDASATELSPRRTAVLVADTALPWERMGACHHAADDAIGCGH